MCRIKEIPCVQKPFSRLQGGNWLADAYNITFDTIPVDNVLINNHGRLITSFEHLCDENGMINYREVPCAIDIRWCLSRIPAETVKLAVRTFMDWLALYDFQPWKDRLKEIDTEIRLVSDLIDVFAQLNCSNVNFKEAHFNLKRAMKTLASTSTSVFIDVYNFIVNSNFRSDLKAQLKLLCPAFGFTCVFPDDDCVSPENADYTFEFPIPNRSNTKANLRKTLTMYHILRVRQDLANYRSRLMLSKFTISTFPCLMSDHFCFNGVDDNVFVHPAHPHYHQHLRDFPGANNFECLYFVKPTNFSHGIVKDARTNHFLCETTHSAKLNPQKRCLESCNSRTPWRSQAFVHALHLLRHCRLWCYY
jgi:hypothetical protein